MSTGPLRIFRAEKSMRREGEGASKLGHYYNEEKTACRGMCAEGEAIPLPKLYVAGQLKNYVLS